MQDAVMPYRAIRTMANPREAEAAFLLDAALRLQDVQNRWATSRAEIDEALLYNHRLWEHFLSSIADPDHPLPIEIRQTIANLGLFVSHETCAIASDPRPERLTALIGINRDLAAGLLGRA